MRYLAFDLAIELMNAVVSKDWYRANDLCEELLKVLKTYKESC